MSDTSHFEFTMIWKDAMKMGWLKIRGQQQSPCGSRDETIVKMTLRGDLTS